MGITALAWQLCHGETSWVRREKMSHSMKSTALLMGVLIAMGSVQPASAFRGPTTKKYCTELVVNKNIIDVRQFNAEVKKCTANPIIYK
jgi:hypothetical protein